MQQVEVSPASEPPVGEPSAGRKWPTVLRRLVLPLIILVGVVAKLAGSFKFLGFAVSIVGYALIWGWQWAIGFVGLIAVHEAGHYLEARRQGLDVSLPQFVPFLGAWVAVRNAPFDPWRNGLVSLAGPVVGSLGALALLIAGEMTGERLLFALAYTGFFLNLANLAPVWILDGASILRSVRTLRQGAGRGGPARARSQGNLLGVLFVALAVALVVGMVVSHVPQGRL